MNINKDEKFLDEERDENSQGAKAESNEIKTSSNDVPNEEADSAKEASTIEKAGAEETNPSIDKNTNKPEDKKMRIRKSKEKEMDISYSNLLHLIDCRYWNGISRICNVWEKRTFN